MPLITLSVNVKDDVYQEPTEWYTLAAKGKADHVIALCARHAIVPQTVLEVGAGDGCILRSLSDAGFGKTFHALEVSASGVSVIRGRNIRGLASAQTFDGYHIPFPDKSIDLTVLSHVLEHVEYERALLRELRRVSAYQVIEIPTDCNALADETYHLLGPSYGHISAHTPDSLRFLLSTEGFAVLDLMMGQYCYELQAYDYFVNNGHPRTPEAEASFRRRFQAAETRFAAASPAKQLALSSFCAVLTREERIEERIARAMRAATRSIAAAQYQAARLIFNHHVPKDQVAQKALELATAAGEAHPKIAREFAERALAEQPSNARARQLIAALAGRDAKEPMPTPAATPTEATLSLLAKDFIKANFPRLAGFLRRMRM